MNKNPINSDEKARQVKEPARVEPDLESDAFSEAEQKKIVDLVLDEALLAQESMADWKWQKAIDIMHLNAERPSIIEALKKKAWMSDRNLGMTAAVCDIYQATLLSTCYNPDSIHFKDTEQNDVNNKDNCEKFSKWGLGQSEANFFPQVDDFINNRVGLGVSYFKIFWEVTYKWVDSRIPKRSKENKLRVIGYDIKTEKRRFERGVIKNIHQVDDILLPNYGENLQSTAFLIEILHINTDTLKDYAKRGIIINYDKKTEKSFEAGVNQQKATLRNEDEKALGQRDSVMANNENTISGMPIDIYERYGLFTRKGKTEEYRFWVEPTTRTFLAGKPLRKIQRSGKRPYVGGPLRRRPGFIRGGSLPALIAPAINALNNTYNQKSDFQFVENMPIGFANFDEQFTEPVYEMEPGKIFGVDGDPTKAVYFPTMQRSLAWAYQDTDFLMQLIERLTGAASYFLATNQPKTTATRDTIVEEKGQTKFGLWVKRIQSDISEAINMWFQLYQDWAPPKLGERVLGEDGKQLIRNLSIDSLRGMYEAYIVPDITSGSKSYERQLAMWGLENLSQSIWFSPQINPRGSWLLIEQAMKKQGWPNPDHYLPPQPKDQVGTSQDVKNEFARFMAGESIDPDDVEGLTPAVVEHYIGHMKQAENQIQDLDEEYRSNFEAHLFKTAVNYQKFIAKMQEEQHAQALAMHLVHGLSKLPGAPGGPPAGSPPPAGMPLPSGGPAGAMPGKPPITPPNPGTPPLKRPALPNMGPPPQEGA